MSAQPCAAPRLLIGGVSSGVGKTTVTVGLCRALQRRGLSVQIFKCGPDYLDPTYHRKASRAPVHNLDSWLMGPHALKQTFTRRAGSADINLIEGVMGLFDGASPTSLSGSSAEIAQLLAAPSVLVVDASGMARSIAALIHGFASFEPGFAPRAVICNRIGSAGHLTLLRSTLPDVPILGGLTRQHNLRFPERHLGLVAAQEGDHEATFDAWADQIEAGCDVPALIALARSAPPLAAAEPSAALSTPRCRIGVARDEAFHFYYDENLHLLRHAGAELVDFSPLTHTSLPDLDGVYIGGGYPELHATRLADNQGMQRALREHAQAGKPIYAECGGFMYLCESIVDRAGREHAMLGLLPGRAVMQDKLQALGYVEAQTRAPSPLGAAGTHYRGHQFRYSRFEGAQPTQLEIRGLRQTEPQLEGYGAGQILGTYVHGHWASNPQIARNFVDACC